MLDKGLRFARSKLSGDVTAQRLDPMNLRIRRVYLTRKGKSFMRQRMRAVQLN